MKWSEQTETDKKLIGERIARNLTDFGYSGITSEMVIEEIGKQPRERNVIGMFAAGMLADNGFTDVER